MTPSRQVLYQEVTGLTFSQFSVITRWGDFDKKTLTKSITLHSTDAAAIKQVQQLVSNKYLEFSAWLGLYCIVLYCIALYCTALYCIVLKGWSLLPNALRPFQIYCAPRIWVLGREYAD